jgi:hypothetical protein
MDPLVTCMHIKNTQTKSDQLKNKLRLIIGSHIAARLIYLPQTK